MAWQRFYVPRFYLCVLRVVKSTIISWIFWIVNWTRHHFGILFLYHYHLVRVPQFIKRLRETEHHTFRYPFCSFLWKFARGHFLLPCISTSSPFKVALLVEHRHYVEGYGWPRAGNFLFYNLKEMLIHTYSRKAVFFPKSLLRPAFLLTFFGLILQLNGVLPRKLPSTSQTPCRAMTSLADQQNCQCNQMCVDRPFSELTFFGLFWK